MDRRMRQVAGLITFLLLAVTVSAGWVQGVRSEQISAYEPVANGQHARNIFRIYQECNWRRGPILSIDGQTLASTKRVTTGRRCKYQRIYPSGNLAAHVVGQWSLFFGKSGLESKYGDELVGDPAPPKSISDLFRTRPRIGNTLISTIDTRLQNAAIAALAGRRGGVVALNPKTGAVMVAASIPSYDPNDLASNNQQVALDAYCRFGNGFQRDPDGSLKRDANGDRVSCSNPQDPMTSVALRAHRPPGSSFKAVTAAAALESGKFTPDTFTAAGSSYLAPGDIPKNSIHNFGGGSCGGTLANALRQSCNISFAKVAVDIGEDRLYSTAQAMDLGQDPGPAFIGCGEKALPDAIPETFTGCLPRKKVTYGADGKPNGTESLSIGAYRARAGFGQWVLQVSPFGMAIVAGTVANGGFVPRPRFADRVIDPTGAPAGPPIRTGIGQSAISPEAAGQLAQMMRGVVTGGTAAAAFGGFGVAVAGKTGTAQQFDCDPASDAKIFGPGCGRFAHAWFICFAPVEDPTIAMAVLVERGGGNSEATGGHVAAPIARKVLEKYFELYPTAVGGNR